jgi:predicted transcriptional regulator
VANVTLSLPDDLLREVRHLAVDENLSLSRFVARSLEQRVAAVARYRAARDRQLRLIKQGLDLGTHGRAAWTRESLHER